MSQPRIPRPRLRKTTSAAILKHMTTYTNEEYEQLRLSIRQSIELLDRKNTWTKQNPVRRQSFLSAVSANNPKIDAYEGFWPVKVYAMQLLDRLRYEARLITVPFLSPCPSRRADSQQVNKCRCAKLKKVSSRRRKEVFVELPPIRYSKCKLYTIDNRENIAPHSDTFSQVERPDKPGLFTSSQGTSASFHRSSSSITTSLPSSDNTNRNGCSSTQFTGQASQTFPVRCLRCGYMPPVSPSVDDRLRYFFRDTASLLPVINSLGIVHNGHLNTLSEWSHSDRNRWFDDLVPLRLNGFQCARLKLIFLQIESSTKALGSSSLIPRPPSDDMDRLAGACCGHVELAIAMKVADDMDVYWDISNTIIGLIARLRLRSRSVEQRDEKWSTFLTEACLKQPLLKRYQDVWPVELYARRYIHRTANTFGQENNNSSFGQSYMPRRNDGATNSRLTMHHAASVCPACPFIPFVYAEFSSELVSFLESCGMTELMPAFTALGVVSDGHLRDLLSMAEASREALFRDTKVIELNEFQWASLKLAFRRASA